MYVTEQEDLEKDRKRKDAFLATLKDVKSSYNLDDMMKDWERMLKVMVYMARYPEFYDKKLSGVDKWTLYPKHFSEPDPTKHQMCFLDLRIGDRAKLLRLKIELYDDVVPMTAENFASLCKGMCDSKLTYLGSIFHRIVPDLWCIGGDIINNSGTGGFSIYGSTFMDENYTLQHNGPGVLAMYSTEPNGNNSQFLITFKKLETLNGKFVVFGRVKSGLKSLKLIESCGTRGGKPIDEVRVEDCGVFERRKTKKSSARTSARSKQATSNCFQS